MNRVFIDTSAVLALLVAGDKNHAEAVEKFDKLKSEKRLLVCNSYILLETYALIGRRIGPKAVTAFRNHFAPLLLVTWTDEALHEAGLDLLSKEPIRELSLVDAVSFVQMEQQNIKSVFSFDKHFLNRPAISGV